jgi:hypothetical protein
MKLGWREEARAEMELAASLTGNARKKELLRQQVRELRVRPGG